MNYKIFTDSYFRGDLAGKLAHQISTALGIRKLSKHSRLTYYCTHKKTKLIQLQGTQINTPEGKQYLAHIIFGNTKGLIIEKLNKHRFIHNIFENENFYIVYVTEIWLSRKIHKEKEIRSWSCEEIRSCNHN